MELANRKAVIGNYALRENSQCFDLSHQEVARRDLHTFSLLSNDCIVIGFVEEALWPVLIVMDLDLQISHYLPYSPLDEASALTCLQIRADPGPLCETTDAVPFHQDSQDFIVVVTMKFSADSNIGNIVHFLSSKYLISLAKSKVETPFHEREWKQWMLQHTRMHITPRSEPSYIWVCHVFGTRFVIIERALDEECRSAVRIYDFNQSAIQRDAQMSAKSGDSGRIETTTNVIAAGHPFTVNVLTTLPYWTNVSSLEGVLACDHGCQMMCSEDNIVIVDVSFLRDRGKNCSDDLQPTLKKYTILVF